MNAETIKELERLITTKETAAILLEDYETALLPDGMRLVSTESLSPSRRRARGIYQTGSITDFVRYIKASGTPTEQNNKTAIFIDEKQCTARAIMNWKTDDGDNGHCDDMAILSLTETPEFHAFCEADARPISQPEMVDFMEDWAGFIHAFDANQTAISTAALIHAFRTVSVRKSSEAIDNLRDTGQTRSRMDDLEARATSMPANIEADLQPFSGWPVLSFKFRMVTHINSADKITFRLRMVGRAQLSEHIFQQFQMRLKTEFGDYVINNIYQGGYKPGA